MSKELPIRIPPMKCWQFSAFPLAILTNYEKSWEWIYSNYIQVKTHEDFLTHPVPFAFYELDYAYNPWLKVQRLDRGIFPAFRTSIVDFVKDCLNLGHYVYLNLDEFYVPNRIPYQKFNRTHDVLVYGYEDEQESFKLLGYNERLIFDKSIISFADFEKAYHHLDQIPNNCNQIYLYQYDEKGAFTFDIKLVIEGLEDYLYARDTASKYRILAEPESTLIFGMDTYPILQLYMEHLLENPDGFVDLRYMHMLWEHKHCMSERVRFLIERGYLNRDMDFYNAFKEVEKSSESARNMLIKFYRSRNKTNLLAVIQLLDQIKKNEYELIHSLLESLKLQPISV